MQIARRGRARWHAPVLWIDAPFLELRLVFNELKKPSIAESSWHRSSFDPGTGTLMTLSLTLRIIGSSGIARKWAGSTRRPPLGQYRTGANIGSCEAACAPAIPNSHPSAPLRNCAIQHQQSTLNNGQPTARLSSITQEHTDILSALILKKPTLDIQLTLL